ncbi:MAG: SIMPL domain-containing protein [Nanobdellota archaeon]
MKNDKILLILNLLVGIVILASLLQADGEDKTLTVTGSAEKKVQPDIGVMTFSVVTQNTDVTAAENENSQINNAIMEQYNATTTAYRISREEPEEFGPMNTSSPMLYTVRNTITVRTTDLDSLGETLSGVLDLGANEVQSVRYELSSGLEESVRDSLRSEAVRDASTKAEELASESGTRITGVKRIQPQSWNYYPMYDTYGGARAEANFRPEPQDVTYSVQIEYVIAG